ncbi:NAD-dependent succinate-semialdehyde dehydrogenase [Jiangella asiatica]|uniref:NAD-dependent succinate-semialdehyde dehydrogenase n=1 Tax=Jiangella asiatica TaxID=2530372 RepID=A0A4R5DCY1_9ACTN|nr:NAD-dependent succinate-semialdehyde dehydrogenase [Jiangella asiatica]TDE08123.1 NAD-dependent succinate-semialdehyde dehydrogenase [Jiangella asiatica]
MPTTAPAPVPTLAGIVGDYVRALEPGHAVWVDGAGRAAAGGARFDVRDPSTGAVIAGVSDGTVADAAAAVDAAAAALPGWSATAPRERGETLRRGFELMREHAAELAALMSWENGKALADSRAEAAYAAEFFRWYAEEAVRTEGEYGPAPAGATRTIVTHRPVGVAALVTPWNFPAAMATRKIAPALAAGCTVVLKPASETPLTALAIARILRTAGVPAGVVNVVPTTSARDVVAAWLADPRVRKLSFTGSTEVGSALLSRAAGRVVNTSMELGGNAPFVVTADADVAAAVRGATVAKFRNGGQACTAANRFYVHADVADAFLERFGATVERLVVGPAVDQTTAIGPLINPRAVDDVRALVEGAVAEGATVTHRAAVPEHTGGSYYPPTVLAGVPATASILTTEIFGPVAPVVTWTDEARLLEHVNAGESGLAAYVYSADLRAAMRLAESIEAGMVGINRGIVSDPAAPFGGLKQSGLGREGGRHGLREFQETQYFSVDWE